MLHYLDMLTHPEINPYIFKIGPIGPTWYGLMYVLGFILAIVLLKRRASRNGWRNWKTDQVDDIVFHRNAWCDSGWALRLYSFL